MSALLAVAGSAGADPATLSSKAAGHATRTLSAVPQTVVTLTFDDGDANQYVVRTMLSSRGMHATFFLNSPEIGNDSSYMTWSQIANLYADGNEIAGHTAYHPDLTQLDPPEAQREICYDRNLLLSHGYPATNFALPFGTYNPTVESLIQACGYNSARTTDQFGLGCTPGPCAETIPPQNAYQTRIAGAAEDGLAALKQEVTLAEQNGGGWAQLLFHDICNGCSGLAISQTNFGNLLNWLQGQMQTNNVVIKTVAQVIGGPMQAAVAGPPLPPAPNGSNATANPSLEQDADGDGVPDCFFTNTWGNESVSWTLTTDAHTGSHAERVDVSHYSSGSDSLLPNQDLGACTPTVIPGHQYRITEWYKSNAPVSFDLYVRKTDWSWAYSTSSANFPASSTWTQASWVTPVVPSGVNGAIAGLEIAQNGFLTVDDLGFDDANPTGGDTTPPNSTISCNGSPCSSGWSTAPVSIMLAASDNTGGSGVKQIVYTTDGSDPSTTNGTVYNGAFTVTSTAIVKYRAYDNAGNAESIRIQTVRVDTAAPTTAISCNVSSCSSGWYTAPVSVMLTASDGTGGSGVSKTVYTTDGSDPSTTNGTVYNGAFTVASTVTVKYRSYDVAGNAEQVNSRTLTLDTSAPTTTIACNGSSCAGDSYTAPVSVTLSASDNSGGSGLSKTVYTTDGSDPSPTNGTLYSSAFTVTSTVTVKYRSYDVAGNGEAVGSRLIQVSIGTPTTTISCNGSGCSSGWYNTAVSVTLQATDTGGPGISESVYTTDGSDPSTTNGTVYSGAFSVGSTTTLKYRSYDNSGGAESVNSQLIQVDVTTPASSISCNGSNCSNGWYNAAVAVTLQASDNADGSGVAKIVYTTDGSDPTATNGIVYSGAFSVGSTTPVKYRAFDVAGNGEATHSQTVQVDAAAPTTAIACNGASCSTGWYSQSVSVSLTATDAGSGVAQIVYTTDGSDPTATNGIVYSGAFSVGSTTAVKYRAFDVAGNAETVTSRLVQVDTLAPTVSLVAPTGNSQLSGQVAFSANGSDNVVVARIDFLVDSNVVGSATAAPFTYTWNSTSVADGGHTIQARGVDPAGNTTTTSAITVTVANGGTNANLLQNPGLEQGSGNIPTCWLLGGYGTNTPTWTWTADAHSGTHAENLVISNYTNGDRKLLQAFNASCATATSAGHQYVVSVWYKSTARSTIFVFASTTGSTGPYNWWAQSPWLPAAATWTQASWTTPVVPSGFTYISSGMGMQNAGSLTMDDFSLIQIK
ncbi:MAG TPA: chitobiase/beta-hexosaminidase C-terminal domain-containing protein [Gaiellaceae bacterium]|nr:chitobiase/beta-hexosaminidase C-terminal domain-containing protein [Gaiellaceae bacterium]